MTDRDDSLIVIDDEGRESEMKILLTFNSEDFAKDYVLFYEEANEEDIFAASYDEEGNLFPVEESSEEWPLINEVLEAYLSEENQEETEE